MLAATQLFEKRQIKNLRSYRLAVIQDGPDLDFFSNPLALSRLALWIAEACAEATNDPLPLVVASLYPATDTYLVLGMGPRRLREENDERLARGRAAKKNKKTKKKKEERGKKKGTKRKPHDDDIEIQDVDNEENSSDEEMDEDSDDSSEDSEDSDEEDDLFNHYNSFGVAFYQVSSEINARVKLDSFDSSVIEVSREDLSRFLEALTVSSLVHHR